MTINKTPDDILEKIYQNPSWCWLSDKEKDTLQKIESIDILKSFIDNHAQNGWKGDPEAFARRISPLLPEKIFKEAITNFPATHTASTRVSKYYLQASKSPTPTMKAILLSKLDSLVLVIDTLIATFGVADFLKPIQGAEAQSKIFKLFIIISLASALASLISPIGAGIFLLAIVAISLIWATIKPTPSELPNATNWTKEVQNGDYATQGRKEEATEIAQSLVKGRHVLIKGPSRTGKSVLAKDLAQRVVDGEFPELAGKTFFHINAANLISDANMVTGKDPIAELLAAMGENYKNCVLVIDEAHTLCQETCPIAEKLKTLLDEKGRFAHVIAITTEREYERDIKENDAFRNRFDLWTLGSTNEIDTKTILYNAILHSNIKPLCSADAIDHLYNISNKLNTPQPYTALQILNTCIQRTAATQISSTEKKLNETRTKLEFFESQLAIDSSKTENLKNITTELENEEKLTKDLKQINERAIDLEKEKNKLLSLTKKIHRKTIGIKKVVNSAEIIHLNILTQLTEPKLRKYIINKAADLCINIEINKNLINEVSSTVYKITLESNKDEKKNSPTKNAGFFDNLTFF